MSEGPQLPVSADTLRRETFNKLRALESLFDDLKLAATQRGQLQLLETGIAIVELIRESLTMALARVQPVNFAAMLRVCANRQGALRDLETLVAGCIRPTLYTMVPTEVIALIEQELWVQVEQRVREQIEVEVHRALQGQRPRPSAETTRSSIEERVAEAKRSRFALILNPWPEYLYEIDAHRNLAELYRAKLDPYASPDPRLRQATPEWFIILSYPMSEGRNALLHTIMASHELMHFRDRLEGLSTGLLKNEGPNWVLPQQVAEAATVMNESPDQVLKQVVSILGNWVQEVLADLLAVRRFGLAYFLAFAQMSLARDLLDRFSPSHPSSRYRLSLMFPEMEQLGYLKAEFLTKPRLQPIRNELLRWQNEVGRTISVEDGYQELALKSLRQAVPSLRKAARKAMEAKEFDVRKFEEIVPDLVDYILAGIPPGQVALNKSAGFFIPDFVSILNAGWVTYIAHMAEFEKLGGRVGLPEPEAVQALGRLLSKAFEIVDVLRGWKSSEAGKGPE